MDYRAGKQEYRNQVRDNHQTVEGIRQRPEQAQVHGGTDDCHQRVDNNEGFYDLRSEEIFDAAGAVQSPTQDGGEGKAAKRYRQQDGNPSAEGGGETADGELCTGSFSVIDVDSAAENGQGGQRADYDGVGENLKDSPHALLNRVGYIGAGVGDGSGTQTGLVGKDSPGHTSSHTDKEGTYHTAGNGTRIERSFKDGLEHFRHPFVINGYQDQSHCNIEHGHKRNQFRRNVSDSLNAAQQNQQNQSCNQNADSQVHISHIIFIEHIEVEQCGINGCHDGIDLRRISRPEYRQYAQDGIEHRQELPFFAQAVLDVIHRSADPISLIVSLSEVHRQGYLCKFRAHSQKCGTPHPENGTRTAQGNRTGYAGDVTGSHGARQRGTYRLERRQRALFRLFLIEYRAKSMLQNVSELPELQSLGSNRQEKSHTDDAHHRWNTPDESIHRIIHLFNNM